VVFSVDELAEAIFHCGNQSVDISVRGVAMGKYFTDEEIDRFMTSWLSEYPDALERAQKLFDQGLDYDRDLATRNLLEKRQVAKTLDFFQSYYAQNSMGFSDLEADVMDRVRQILRS
jgi:hypothetical protein